MAIGDEFSKGSPRSLVSNEKYLVTVEGVEEGKRFKIKTQVVPGQYGKSVNNQPVNWLVDFDVEADSGSYSVTVRKLGGAAGTTVLVGKGENPAYRQASFNDQGTCTFTLTPGDPSIGIM